MARGFNTTLGAGTTDQILAAYTGSLTVCSLGVLVNRQVDTTGARRIFSQQGADSFGVEIDHNNATTSYNIFADFLPVGRASRRLAPPGGVMRLVENGVE